MRATDYLTGMRAYAALAVLMIHALGIYAEHWPSFWRSFVYQGPFGVIVFFTLSGFVISMSIDRTPAFDFRRFMLKRFFRIAPLYYAVMVFAVLMTGDDGNLVSLFLHMTFLNVFDVRHMNDLVGVEWSIAIEMSWYLLLPAAVLLINRRHGWTVVILATAAIYWSRLLMVEIAPAGFEGLARHWAPQTYAPAFALGVLSYKIYRDHPSIVRAASRPAASLLILAAIAVQVATGWLHDRHFYSIMTAAIILTSLPTNRLASLLLANPIAVYLGQISYSIYLTHFLVIGVMAGVTDQPFENLVLVIAATVAVSSLTYFLIERPFQRVSYGEPADFRSKIATVGKR